MRACFLCFLCQNTVPVGLLWGAAGKLRRHTKQLRRLVAELEKRIQQQCPRNRVIALCKELLLENAVVAFECIQEVKINGSIRIVIPDLHKIDARFAVKSGVIEIKTLLFCDDLIPVSKIQIQIPACPDTEERV